MLYINKKQPPSVFLQAKREFEHYDNLPGDRKDQLKKILLEEQDHLCAYCMVRINMENSTIEHYIPRNGENGDPLLSLEYRNLLAVCRNGRSRGNTCRHCDVTRGNKDLKIDPRNRSDIQKIDYKKNGTIYSEDERIDRDLDDTLNLNHPALQAGRREVVNQVLLEISKRYHGRWNRVQIQKCLDHLRDASPKSSYAGIVIYELEKRLKRG